MAVNNFTPDKFAKCSHVEVWYRTRIVENTFCVTPMLPKESKQAHIIGLEPLVPLGFALVDGQEKSDYHYVAENLKKSANLGPDDNVVAYVGDQDRAMISGLRESSLFDENKTLYMPCELHVRSNMEVEMEKCGFSDEEQKVCLSPHRSSLLRPHSLDTHSTNNACFLSSVITVGPPVISSTPQQCGIF